ncbi:putative solute carrier family 35 member C1 [Schistosoma mansoni]|uniref:putative solute carrier family 35 member C1 n=1 Tax=Schistosoma mansoni TaxID=6183 RepID=UPI0001A63C7A|nr:putative solute carrier family 35 member C1 [Schistosoma mansoni]|eukprot:XP_018652198.1 putative solute carrier family 35 member C1 [Schistosoma mansoni]
MSDSIETHNLEDLSPVVIDTVITTKSRLPEFDRSDPELWFAQLEHYFTRHNIKSEGIRYRDLCSILPPSVAKEVRDLILDPPSPQPYTILRREIINRLSLSDSQRIQRLFQGETLGDRSPSQFLRHLQVLMGDNTVGEAVLKQGWIQALPCYVQYCLDAQDPETSLSHLARIADRIMERGPPTGPGTINHTQKVESAKDPVIEGLIASVKSLTEAVTRMQMGHRNRSRSPQRPRSKSQNRSQMSRQPGQFCWHHWKFGVNSTKCMQPCAWPKHNSKTAGNELSRRISQHVSEILQENVHGGIPSKDRINLREKTPHEPSFKTKDEAKDFLKCLCDQELTVDVSDGRRYIGFLCCTDNVGNIVMSSCTEYPAPSDSAPDNLLRNFPTVVIPGQHIMKIECSLSWIGLVFGIASSITCALNSIYTAKCLPKVEGSVWRLTFYNNLNSLFLSIPIIGLLEYQPIKEHLFQTSAYFWFVMIISGIFGFAIGYISTLQIQVTSPLTHNVSGTAKAAAQTVLAVIIYHEIKSISWWLSNIVVLGGSAVYAAVRHVENEKKPKGSMNFNRNDNSFASVVVVGDDDDVNDAKRGLLNFVNNNNHNDEDDLYDKSRVLSSSKNSKV